MSAPPIEPSAEPRPRWRLLLPALLAMLWKGKWLLSLLKLGKFGGTLISMAATLGFYAWLFGWRFAAGFIALLFLHEMGHAFMLKRQGIPAGAPVFIPMVGAAIALKGRPRDARSEALMAIAGPIAGTLAALACWGLFRLTGSALWAALANVGFLMNLFNLLPVSPLDGGRVAGAISKWLWGAGMVLLLAGIWLWQSPILILVLVLAGLQFWQEWRRPPDETASYYALESGERLKLAAAYFGLALCLGWLVNVSHTALSTLRLDD